MWRFEHAVDSGASPEFFWRYWTDRDNWSVASSLGEIHLEGPFRAGTRGMTRTPEGETQEWRIVAVEEFEHAAIETRVGGITARFEWEFGENEEGGTRLVQRVELTGPRADEVGPQLEEGVPLVMAALAESAAQAEERGGT